MALRELLAEFTIDPTKAQAGLKALDAGLAQASSALGGLVQAFVGSAMIAGVKSFIEGQIAAAKEVRLTADKLGVGTDALQEFQFAAGIVGVEAEGAANGLKFLNKNVGEALTGNKEAAQTFARLGVSLKGADGAVREIGDILPEVADAFAKMDSQQERTAMSMQLFGRQGADLLPLLKQGSKGIDELREKFHALGGGMSKEFIQRAKDAGRAMGATKFGLQAIKRAIVFEALPGVTAFARKAQDWTASLLRLNKETNFAKEAMGVFGVASAAATLKSASGFAKLLGILPKGASFWEAVLGLGEFALLAAGIALVALGLEDLFGFLTGKDSVIGELVESLFGIGTSKEVIDEVREAFKEFWEDVEDFRPIWDVIAATLKDAFVAALPYLKEFAKYKLTELAEELRMIAAYLRFVIGVLGTGIKMMGIFGNSAGKVLEAVGASGLGQRIEGISGAFSKTGGALMGAAVGAPAQTSVPRAGAGGGAGDIMSNSNNHVTNNITVNANGDPRENGRAVADAISDDTLTRELDNSLAATQWGR